MNDDRVPMLAVFGAGFVLALLIFTVLVTG